MCKLPFLRGEYDEELQYYALICFERNSFCHGKRNEKTTLKKRY